MAISCLLAHMFEQNIEETCSRLHQVCQHIVLCIICVRSIKGLVRMYMEQFSCISVSLSKMAYSASQSEKTCMIMTWKGRWQGWALQCMQVLRALTAQEESASKQELISEKQLITMLTVILAMLAALNPIQPPRRPTAPAQHPSGMPAQPSEDSDNTAHTQAPGGQSIPPTDSCLNADHEQPHEALPDQLSGQHISLQAHNTADMHDTNKCQAPPSTHQALSQQHADSPEELIRLAGQFPKQSPYKGYRCDLVALLANLCFRRHAVQDAVQQLGGVELILSQCQV